MSMVSMLHRSPVAKASNGCKQQAEDMPGYPQEDIIILLNKGSVTVSQKKRRRGSDVRTQEGQYV